MVHHQDHLLGVRIADFQQVAHCLGKVHGGALFGHGDVAVPHPGFGGQKQVGGPTTFVFVVVAAPPVVRPESLGAPRKNSPRSLFFQAVG